MDPSTGIFTSMDTYGGNIFDPVSLHKYLFANANPVMYCDPSGHAPTLTDFLAGMAIGACVGAALSALDYSIMALLSGPETNDYSWGGLLQATLNGFVRGAIAGLIIPLLIFPIICFAIGILGIVNYGNTIKRGISLVQNGNIALGIYTILKGVVGLFLSTITTYAGVDGTGISFKWDLRFNSMNSFLNYYFPSRINTDSVDGFLEQNIPQNFRNNVREAFTNDIRVRVAEEDMIVYRYYGNSSGEYSYWYTNQLYSDPNEALALPPGNSATNVGVYVIPSGSPYIDGTVSSNFGSSTNGGGYQIYIPNRYLPRLHTIPIE